MSTTRQARQLRHYQRKMVIYRRRLAYVTQLMREVMQAHARDAMAVVGWYSKCNKAEADLKLAQAEITELRNRGWGNDPVIAELRARVAELEEQLKTARNNFVWLGKELDDD